MPCTQIEIIEKIVNVDTGLPIVNTTSSTQDNIWLILGIIAVIIIIMFKR